MLAPSAAGVNVSFTRASGTSHLRERVTWTRLPDLPGIELLRLENTDRHWRVINDAFGIGASLGWEGDVICDGRPSAMTRGASLCVVPGQVHSTPRTRRRGNFQSVTFTPPRFESYLAEHGVAPGCGFWATPVAPLSASLLKSLEHVFALAGTAHTALEIQAGIVDLVALAVDELLDTRPRKVPLGQKKAERIRECLHFDEGDDLSLDALAGRTGMTRYQVVRTFTARYGVAPHAYQLCRKIMRARQLLRDGMPATDVATACGFADQSHFGRHFRRQVGVTPGQYARAMRETRTRGVATARAGDNRT